MILPAKFGLVKEMNIMKKYRFPIAVMLVAALLCGCSNGNSSSSNSTVSVEESDSSSDINYGGESSSDTGTSSAPAESSEPSNDTSDPTPPIDPPSGDETFLVGLAGDRISASEITKVFSSDGSDVAPGELTEDNFSAVLCDGFVYVAQSTGIARNSLENADVYDSGNMEFTDMTDSNAPLKNYVRLEVGNTFCGLTLREAQVNFARGLEQTVFWTSDGSKLGSELGLPEIYFASGSAKFDGELVMTGYICCLAEDDYGVGAGDIIFVPNDGEGNFPIMSYSFNGDNGFHHISQLYSLSDLVWQNEFGYIYLGNSYDTTADISSLPDDGSFVKVRVTLDNFELNCGVNFINSVRAEIVDISEVW